MDPREEEANGATYHLFFLSLSNTLTSSNCATKNAVPDPIAILIEIKSPFKKKPEAKSA